MNPWIETLPTAKNCFISKPLPAFTGTGCQTIKTFRKGENVVAMCLHKGQLMIATNRHIYRLTPKTQKLKRVKLIMKK